MSWTFIAGLENVKNLLYLVGRIGNILLSAERYVEIRGNS